MKSKEQELIDICFSVAMIIYNYNANFTSREEVAEYVTKQLKQCGYQTKPCGMSWGVLQDKL